MMIPISRSGGASDCGLGRCYDSIEAPVGLANVEHPAIILVVPGRNKVML